MSPSRWKAGLWLAVVVIGLRSAVSAAAEQAPLSLTLERTLQLARERAPALLAARAKIDEARGERTAAGVLLRENPTLEGGLGRRGDAEAGWLEAEVGLRQPFELGGRRGARIAAADAEVKQAEASAGDAERRLLREAAELFLRAVHARETLRLADAAVERAAELERVALRRNQAGELTLLELNLVAVAHARARADRLSAAAEGRRDTAHLAALLGITDAAVQVEGALRAPPPEELPTLRERLKARPDLAELRAAVTAAEAEQRLGEASGWPDVSLGVQYRRETTENIVLGTASLSLPVFERGQGLRATGAARAQRLRIEAAALEQSSSRELEAAFDTYRAHVEAVEILERGAVPRLDQNEGLAWKSYAAGELGLPALLLVRDQLAEGRRAYLDQLLSAALAAIEVEAAAGMLR